MLDTNIYIRLVKDASFGAKITERLLTDDKYLIYGFEAINQELKNIPEKIKIGDGRSFREELLNLYFKLTKGEHIEETEEIKELANKYYEEYKIAKRNIKKEDIINDFKIIACASIKKFEIIVSEDEKSMKDKIAREIYKRVNFELGYRTPTFYTYENIRKRYF